MPAPGLDQFRQSQDTPQQPTAGAGGGWLEVQPQKGRLPMNAWVDAECRAERAYELYELGRWTEAAVELRAALAINPYNAAWHFNLGLTLESPVQYE